MKRTILFLLLLAGLAAVSGFMMSHMSWIGRVGINLVHKEYKFLKVWWQGAAVVYSAFLVLFVIHWGIQKLLPLAVARIIHILLFAVAAYGLFLTFSDFSDDFTHRLLKSVFHLGAYLFWVGWMLICIFYASIRKKVIVIDKTGQEAV